MNLLSFKYFYNQLEILPKHLKIPTTICSSIYISKEFSQNIKIAVGGIKI